MSWKININLKVQALRLTPNVVLQLVAQANRCPMSYYTTNSRKREYVEIRTVAGYLLRKHFERHITLEQIASLFNLDDHTTVAHMLRTAKNRLHTKDALFMEKLERAELAINAYLERIKQYQNEKANDQA